MKKTYERPTFETIEIENKDIITNSETVTPASTEDEGEAVDDL